MFPQPLPGTQISPGPLGSHSFLSPSQNPAHPSPAPLGPLGGLCPAHTPCRSPGLLPLFQAGLDALPEWLALPSGHGRKVGSWQGFGGDRQCEALRTEVPGAQEGALKHPPSTESRELLGVQAAAPLVPSKDGAPLLLSQGNY